MLDTGEDKPDSDIEYSGITDYDNYRSEQVEWMKTLKENPDFQQATFRVVVAHMPPSAEPGIWHGQKEVLEKFVPILNELGIDLMLCGHLHRTLYEAPSSAIHFPIQCRFSSSGQPGNASGSARYRWQIRHSEKLPGEVIYLYYIM